MSKINFSHAFQHPFLLLRNKEVNKLTFNVGNKFFVPCNISLMSVPTSSNTLFIGFQILVASTSPNLDQS